MSARTVTANRDELLALAARCEAAAGPNTHLDFLIHVATQDFPYMMPGSIWTRSLDAALTLVPEGWWADIEVTRKRAGVAVLQNDLCGWAAASAATPALALCAAGLRARAAATVDD